MSSEESSRLPFEPAKQPKKPAKRPPRSVSPKGNSAPKARSSSIPQIVSSRMARRMAGFCGVPTGLGMATFILSYFIISNHWFELPPIVTLLVSLGFFGLGVLGLSYGVLSASWDPEQAGGFWGWQEFKVNLGRTTEAWKTAKQKQQDS
jgi:hypothetical protein